MHVGLITYQHGHRKTLEVALKLMTRGHQITLFAFPFTLRPPKPNPPYQDRPSQLMDFDVVAFCLAHQIGYVIVGGWDDKYARRLEHYGLECYGYFVKPPCVYLNCIAKIIPASFITGRIILNAHPGLLPQNRGVDAFKWAIVNGWPLGVTLHAIDEEIDRGTILYRRVLPVLPTDTLATVCQRAYDFECDMLANFDAHLSNAQEAWEVGDEFSISHKRIPRELDDRLEEIFLERREMLATRSYSMPWAADDSTACS